jgi:hypothetical protein
VRSNELDEALDELAGADVAASTDRELADQLRALLAAANRLSFEIGRRVAAFDHRGLATADGCRSAVAWLRGFGRMSGPAASACLKRARLLEQLPAMTGQTSTGAVSADHVDRLVTLAARVGPAVVVQADHDLAAIAAERDPVFLGRVCSRIVAHVDPDGAEPHAAADFSRRSLTITPFDGMVVVRGQLDPEGGAALTAALDAFLGPPAGADDRTPTQRRADALVELMRDVLRSGRLPTAGGVRPQVAVLVTPAQLAGLSGGSQRGVVAGGAAEDGLADSGSADSGFAGGGPASGGLASGGLASGGLVESALAATGPAQLAWVGDVSATLAQRVACDADVWRLILDPASGQPMNVGRAHRIVPHWIRKALHVRDHGCRFPGCGAPAPWTDAHHLVPWARGGGTDVGNLLLLCRFHHGLLHEGGWKVHYDTGSDTVSAFRPDGRPYEITIRGPAVP